jgi:hypothetical protein
MKSVFFFPGQGSQTRREIAAPAFSNLLQATGDGVVAE